MKKNNKGFTLIELLAVIIILALLALITSTVVTKIVKDSKEDMSSMQVQLIKSAAEMWGSDNPTMLPSSGECGYLNLSDLKRYGLLSESIVDSNTNQEISDDLKIKISVEKVNGNIVKTYEVNPESVEGCRWTYSELYVDSSGANRPNLYNKTLTPVIYDKTYDNNKGAWLIADQYEKWYDYDEQWWANAVILSSTARTTKKVGDPLELGTDVFAMFVWVPRYSYTIGNTYGVQLEGGSTPSQATPGAIDIKFISKNIKETGAATYTGTTPSNWYTHPAFTFVDKELSGIWVGKFETSHETLSENASSSNINNLKCTDENCENADGLRILPNVKSLLYNNISNFFFASRSISREGNAFGINTLMTDSHLMKNSEWGAVTYLSQSRYGKYGNIDYEGVNKEVYQNKSSEYITGSSNGTPSQEEANIQFTYDIEKNGTGASTTGNIYGIYDMSGGAFEYVMGVLADSSGKPRSGLNASQNSGFNGSLNGGTYSNGLDFPDSKYYDLYIVTLNAFCKDENGNTILECRGHALSETSGWYSDRSDYVSDDNPWFTRGSIYYKSSIAGVFSSGYDDGNHENSGGSFRIVLS